MTQIRVAVSIVVLALSTSPVFAQKIKKDAAKESPPPAAPGIVFMDPERVLATTKEGQTEVAGLQTLGVALQAQIDEKEKEIQTAEKEFEGRKANLSEKEKKERQKSIDDLKQGLGQTREQTLKQFNEKRQTVFMGLEQKIRAIVGEYAAEKHFAAVLILDPQRTVYVDPAANITDVIVQAYDAKYPPAPAAPAVPAATIPPPAPVVPPGEEN